MAKANRNTNIELDSVTTEKLYDKTNKHLYVSKNENKVTLCDSIDDIVNGVGETYKFIKKMESVRTFTKDEKTIEKNFFVLLSLADGNTLLLKRYNEMK